MALGFSAGTSSIVTASEQVPASTSFSPPCMVVIRIVTAAVGAVRCNSWRQRIRRCRGKYVDRD